MTGKNIIIALLFVLVFVTFTFVVNKIDKEMYDASIVDAEEKAKLHTEVDILKSLDKINKEEEKSIHKLLLDEIGKLKLKQVKDSESHKRSHKRNLDKYDILLRKFLKLEKSFQDEMDKKDKVIEL